MRRSTELLSPEAEKRPVSLPLVFGSLVGALNVVSALVSLATAV
jgi:hypothetical protein